MFRKICSPLFALFLLVAIMPVAKAADIAVIDFADQWTQVRGLTQSLDEYGYDYDDITDDVEGGNMDLDGYRLLFMSAMYTNNAALHQSVDNNAAAIHDFVDGGGIVIEPTQADQNEANVDWLPDGLLCVRSDPDPSVFTIEEPEHPVFNEPHKFTEDEFSGWGHQGWPTGWEVITAQDGFDVLMVETGTNKPIIMEAEYGNGMFVMMCLAPDKYHVAGNDDNTKEMAGKLMENIMATWYDAFTPVESSGKLTASWGEIKVK
ncbi:hypothetical protein GF312_06110 [Candidatus Poribacteria bacterium]|nr:hypothetical protein [Candidatus Poribacteria bacterium]